MKKILLLAILCMWTLLGFAQPGAFNRIYSNFSDGSTDQVLVMAHRSDWHRYPENSMSSLYGAIELGVDIVEIDVRITSDGVLVLMHDVSVNRTTNGSGRVSGMTLAQLKALTLDGSTTDETVPTLEEFMLAAKGNIMVVLDIKIDLVSNWDVIYSVLEKTGTVDHAIWQASKSYATVKAKLAQYPDVIYCPKIGDYQSDPVTTYNEFVTNVDLETVFFRFPTEKEPILTMIPDAQTRNIKLFAHTLTSTSAAGRYDPNAKNDPHGNWGWLIEKGFSIIMTDEYEILLDYLRSIGKHPYLNEVIIHNETIETNEVPVVADFVVSGLSEGDYIWYESDGTTIIPGETLSTMSRNIFETTTLYVGSVTNAGQIKVPVTVNVRVRPFCYLPIDDAHVRAGEYSSYNYSSHSVMDVKTKNSYQAESYSYKVLSATGLVKYMSDVKKGNAVIDLSGKAKGMYYPVVRSNNQR